MGGLENLLDSLAQAVSENLDTEVGSLQMHDGGLQERTIQI
jgi:hypothetical protein